MCWAKLYPIAALEAAPSLPFSTLRLHCPPGWMEWSVQSGLEIGKQVTSNIAQSSKNSLHRKACSLPSVPYNKSRYLHPPFYLIERLALPPVVADSCVCFFVVDVAVAAIVAETQQNIETTSSIKVEMTHNFADKFLCLNCKGEQNHAATILQSNHSIVQK
jgi:hypothetical protein